MLVVHGMENIYPNSKKIKKVFICANTCICWGESGDFEMLKKSININKDEDTSVHILTLHLYSLMALWS
jgi:hypothetical protein